MKTIRSIKKFTAKEAVIKALQDYIIRNNLSDGDPLPPEQVLAENLGVSRNILREALQYYKTLGIIDSRPKTGAFIKQLFPQNPFQGFLPYFASSKHKIDEIYQLRQVIELGAAPFVIQHAGPDDVETLSRLAATITQAKGDGANEVEVEFHSTYLSLCRNEMLNSLKPLIIDFFNSSGFGNVKKKPNETITREHQNIVEAIRDKNLDNLSNAIIAHYHIVKT